MTNPPADLGAFRTGVVIPLTGLSGNDVGIAPDASHLSSGGYHVGCQDIQSISRWNTDYSTRQARDRQQPGTNVSSATDIGDDWPNGGRPAWLRFNNLLVAELRAGDPALAALRAVNFSPDGTATKRYDSFNPSQGVIDSTDSVYMHTHLEWWRDTAGTPARARSLARIGQIIDAAIRNTPLEGEDMANLGYGDRDGEFLCERERALLYLDRGIMGPEKGTTFPVVELLKRLDAGVAALQARPALDVAALAAALAPLLSDHLGVEVSADQLVAALDSEAGQAALVKAANTAEDS